MSDGQIGCYLSHRKAWQEIVDRQLDYAIVLEDDFFVDESIHQAIDNFETLTLPWQLIKLSAYQSRRRPIAFASELKHQQKLVIHKKLMTGCCATAISLEAAKRLLEATHKFGRPVDSDLQHCWETGVFGYSILPYPIKQNDMVESDIALCSKKQRYPKAFFRRKVQQLKSAFLNKTHTLAFVKRTKEWLKGN